MSDATFTAVSQLIALVADPKACAKRLEELRKVSDEVARSQARLDADARTVATDKAAADEREKTLRDREVAVAMGERILNKGREELAAARRAMAVPPVYVGPGGLTQEAYSE
jgi:hypothetical protein